MSRVMDPQPKFLPPEWRLANQIHYGSAEAKRSRSERLKAKSKRLIEESGMAIKHMQRDANKRLEQRIYDIKFWKSDLEEIVQEMKVLITCKSRVERPMERCAESPCTVIPLRKEKRSLVQKVQIIPRTAAKDLVKVLEETGTKVSISTVKRVEYRQPERLLGKEEATAPKPTTLTPEEWETFSNITILKAEHENNNSPSLRALLESLLEQTAADMCRQHNATGNALRLQVQETNTAKGLEDHLAKVLSEVASQEWNLEALRVAIKDKVAQTRLSARSQRPSIELCHDPAQVRLLSEPPIALFQPSDTPPRLREAQAEMELLALTRSHLILEEEIQSRSIYIDEVICTQLRQPISTHSF
uniref:Tektin n=1 Tax=Oncorhynchus tshawytscha TaxID=74940 RepID=A0A8C8G2K8_ONCTS